MSAPQVSAVEAAADEIVAAYAATDRERYFAGFDPDATFVFHPEPSRIESRAEYESLWDQWVSEGWRVVSCRSSERRVQPLDGGAIFTHTVDTVVETPDGTESSRERETIVFALQDGALLAVHEHLSPAS